MVLTSKSKGSAFLASSILLPWIIPQSSSIRLPAASTKWHDPVTAPAAPKTVTFMIHSSHKTHAIHTSKKAGLRRL
jgi:hypothetical protein